MDEFKIGDVIRLKSGGPQMTVCGQSESGSEEQVYLCCWFNGESGEQGSFPRQALEFAGRKPRKKGKSSPVLMFQGVPTDLRFKEIYTDVCDEDRCNAAIKPMNHPDGRFRYRRCAMKKYKNGLCGSHFHREREAGRTEWNETLQKETA